MRTPRKKSAVDCRPRIRIMVEDKIALGPGKIDLLETVRTTGSISRAARTMGLSYRRAWDMIDTMNQCFRQPLVESTTGGKGGGGAHLTPFGEKMARIYREMESKAMRSIQMEWKTIRKELNLPEK
ncbi:MAG: LysR family transcriptional regulator [Nitrospinae bacterium CG11_big_fil_rev_8_21_14_0_20_56_8]|nr:MAG: LysR family transcriptional regulator [Nitrospinae bacterium CG11_big_fil_rev_8_21_14_0_20_56_8]